MSNALVLMYAFTVLVLFFDYHVGIDVPIYSTFFFSPARVAAKIAVASDQMQSPCANA